jgi:hypothetical protein
MVKLVSPVRAYYHSLPQLGDELQRQWALLDTHDTLTDWYKHFRSLPEIRNALENLGLEDISCTAGGNGVEARGRRPIQVQPPPAAASHSGRVDEVIPFG